MIMQSQEDEAMVEFDLGEDHLVLSGLLVALSGSLQCC